VTSHLTNISTTIGILFHVKLSLEGYHSLFVMTVGNCKNRVYSRTKPL
jgi:hypothetical protein